MVIELKAKNEAAMLEHPVYEVWMCGNMGRAREKVFRDLKEAVAYKRRVEAPYIEDE